MIHSLLFVKDDVVGTSSIGFENKKDLETTQGIQVNVKETSSQCKYIKTIKQTRYFFRIYFVLFSMKYNPMSHKAIVL